MKDDFNSWDYQSQKLLHEQARREHKERIENNDIFHQTLAGIITGIVLGSIISLLLLLM